MGNMRMNKVFKGTVTKNKVTNKMKDMPINNFPIQQNSSDNIHSENINGIQNENNNNNSNCNTFEQYVETKHNDYWLKRKHLFQKNSNILRFQKEESCSMMILDTKDNAILNIRNNKPEGTLSKDKRGSSSSSNLAFKKR